MAMSTQKVAVVTGANKGIGFAIVKGLCKKYGGKIYLTARNEILGKEAVKKLEEIGLLPVFHQLDITDPLSVKKFKDHIDFVDRGIDILVNNAGMAFKIAATELPGVQAEATVSTNYFGTLRVCESLFPLLRANARVINITSSGGHLSKIPSLKLRTRFSHPNLTVAELSKMMHQFIKDCKGNNHIANGWGDNIFMVSKVAVSALTVIQQKEFNKTSFNGNISVNSVYPGYVATDMSSHRGPLTTDEGARAPLYLALGLHNLKGEYVWHDTRVVDWFAPSAPVESY
ncbi:hypothetical protein FQA39_LY10733 [Lamprigera yunnana]|nr:hypothetical protein FQA39_LY10733 [Lamprigera yunnana]